MLIISFVQFIICIITAILAWRILKSGRPSLLAITVLGFVALDSLGLSFAPYFPLERLPYIENPVFLIRSIPPALYLRQCLSHWIFLTTAVILLLQERKWPIKEGIRKIQNPSLWALFFFVFGIVLSIKYYLIGPGIEILRDTRLSFFSTGDAVTHRSQGSLMAGLGQGAYLASLGAQLFFPLASILALQGKRSLRKSTYLLSLSISFVFAFQARQKGLLLIVGLMYLLIYLASTSKSLTLHKIRKIALVILVLAVSGAFLLYMVNFGLRPGAAIGSVFYRVFFVPAATETNYFVVFPDKISFRGFSNCFSIPLGKIVRYDDATIYDVAIAALGLGFSSNASFLAVAWSGKGYLAVILVSLIYCFLHFFIDRWLRKVHIKIALYSYAITVPTIIILVSAAFIGYMNWGGIIIPIVLIALSQLSRKNLVKRSSDINYFNFKKAIWKK